MDESRTNESSNNMAWTRTYYTELMAHVVVIVVGEQPSRMVQHSWVGTQLAAHRRRSMTDDDKKQVVGGS